MVREGNVIGCCSDRKGRKEDAAGRRVRRKHRQRSGEATGCSERRCALFPRSCSIPTPSGRPRILPGPPPPAFGRATTTGHLLSTTTWSGYHLLVRRQRGAPRHVTDSPSPQVDERWACLPAPVAPLPLRRGLSRQVHQPKCHSAYLCVVPTKPACPVVRFFPLSFSLSLSSSLLFPSFFSLSLPSSLSLTLSLCTSLLFSAPRARLRPSPSVSVCPLRRRLTQQCGVVVSCHPALRQRSSRTCGGNDRSLAYLLSDLSVATGVAEGAGDPAQSQGPTGQRLYQLCFFRSD